jgi:probable F420-dependent oxidoreductase
MKIGAVYPQIELGGDPAALDRIGRTVEELGYDHLLMYDHVVGAVHADRDPPLWGPYTEQHPFHDPFVAFGYLAGITRTLGFVTGVLILPQRQTVLVAKQAADVDLVSGGRLTLGVGTGWNYVEYDALGQDFQTRGPRMSEQIPFLRRLWGEPVLSFQGQFDRIERGNIIPRPKRQIPILCGGFAEPAYRRAAKMADGFIFAGSFDSGVLPGWQRMQELLAEADRPVDGFRAQLVLQTGKGKGIPLEAVADKLRTWQDAGGTHASIVSMGLGFTTVDQHLDYFAEVKRRLG